LEYYAILYLSYYTKILFICKGVFFLQKTASQEAFSPFHCYRLFRTATGLPVMQYILHRRLLPELSDCL